MSWRPRVPRWRRTPAKDDPRERLLERLRPHVADARVLEAIEAVPRDRFVPPDLAEEAWDNVALPIAAGQTISQPLVVARMCELLALSGGERVLDVGTGSGYHAAVLAQLAAHVWSIERHAELSAAAEASLAELGVDNVTLVVGDGAAGHPDAAPYDAINVAAAMAVVPRALSDQLAEGGRLVGPVNTTDQRLVCLRRGRDGLTRSDHERVRFVPLITNPQP